MQPRILLLKDLEDHPIGKIYHAPFDAYLDQHNVFQPDIVVNAPLTILTDGGASRLFPGLEFEAARILAR